MKCTCVPTLGKSCCPERRQPNLPWQCLNFLPDPQGQSSLRPTLPQLDGSFGFRSACASFPLLLPASAGASAGDISSSPVIGSTLCASMYGSFEGSSAGGD